MSGERQRSAIAALLKTLDPELLRLPESLVELIPPRPPGFRKSRETFHGDTGATFDPLAPASSAVALTLDALFEPSRAARLVTQHAAYADLPAFTELCDAVMGSSWYAKRQTGMQGLIQRRTNALILRRLMQLSVDRKASDEVRAIASDSIKSLDQWLSERKLAETDRDWRSQLIETRLQISRFWHDPDVLQQIKPAGAPPGSPIGAETMY